MASPQLENGYTKIANELLEALARIRIPGEARQIFDVILRKTYGFQKKEDFISLSQFCLATGIIKPSVIRAIKTLLSMNIIYKNANKSLAKKLTMNKEGTELIRKFGMETISEKANDVINDISEKANGKQVTYRLNKDYSTWKPLAKKLTFTKKLKNVSEKANKSLAKKLPTKDNNTKEIRSIAHSSHLKEAFKVFWIAYPKKVGKYPSLKAWLKLKPDNTLVETILKAIEAYKETKQWQDRQYIPYPATWLNQKRWEDEVEEKNDDPLEQYI